MVYFTDVEPPTVSSCPADIINTTDPGLSNATVYWQEPTFSDNDGVSSNTSTHRPGDTFGLESTTVTYNVTDNSGNMANCSFVVTIEGMLNGLMHTVEVKITHYVINSSVLNIHRTLLPNQSIR